MEEENDDDEKERKKKKKRVLAEFAFCCHLRKCSYLVPYTADMAVSMCVTLQKSVRNVSAYACWGNIPGGQFN